MNKRFLKIGTMLAALAVGLGAFGAHALKNLVAPDALVVFETAVRYQMYHAFAIMVTGILFKDFTTKKVLMAGELFLLGIILFSGSLYLLTYIKTIGADNFLWVGAITPLGGVCFIVGWMLLCASFFGRERK